MADESNITENTLKHQAPIIVPDSMIPIINPSRRVEGTLIRRFLSRG